MKTIVSFKTLLVAGFLLVCATSVKAGDVSLRIPVTSVNKLFETVVHSNWFNYGAVSSGIVSYYSVKMDSVSIKVQPNNQFTFRFKLQAYADFDLGLFSFDETSNGVLSGSGTLILVPVGDGYKITFDMQSISYSASDWYADLLNFSLQVFKSKIPEISTSSEQPLLPTSVSSFFTSATPTLTTTATEIVLSFDLASGPRNITAYNEVNGDTNIGNIENTTGGEENLHKSPYTFKWYAGSQKSIRTPYAHLFGLGGTNNNYVFVGSNTYTQYNLGNYNYFQASSDINNPLRFTGSTFINENDFYLYGKKGVLGLHKNGVFHRIETNSDLDFTKAVWHGDSLLVYGLQVYETFKSEQAGLFVVKDTIATSIDRWGYEQENKKPFYPNTLLWENDSYYFFGQEGIYKYKNQQFVMEEFFPIGYGQFASRNEGVFQVWDSRLFYYLDGEIYQQVTPYTNENVFITKMALKNNLWVIEANNLYLIIGIRK